MSFRNFHLLVGGAGLLVFVLQGQYMAGALDVVHQPDASRMMYRSAHIYFLLSCVVNVSLGYALPATTPVNHIQRLVSSILLIAPGLLLVSFMTESTVESLDRPVSKAALYLMFGAATLLVLHELYRRVRNWPGRH